MYGSLMSTTQQFVSDSQIHTISIIIYTNEDNTRLAVIW